MPLYHFCLASDGEFIWDPEGAFLPDDGSALRAAADVIAEFRSRGDVEQHSWADWRLEIFEAGRKVGTLVL